MVDLQTHNQLEIKNPSEPVNSETHLRLVCISDTHNQIDENFELPDGDVLVHAGDFSNVGTMKEIKQFNDFLKSKKQQFKHMVIIAGNHDIGFDVQDYEKLADRFHQNCRLDPLEARKLLTEGIYLENSGCVIDGVEFWGSPYQPEFYGWAFNLQRGEPCAQVWRKCPANVDVMVTHGPVLGHGDLCLPAKARAGCVDMLKECQLRIKPKFHISGHIHEGYGISTDGTTKFVNASTCTMRYKPENRPIVIDVPKPNNWQPGVQMK